MRILIAHEALAGGGGVESYLAALVPALQARGHQIAFLHYNPRSERGPTRLEFPAVERIGVIDDGIEAAMSRAAAWGPQVCFTHNMRALEVETRLLQQAPVVKMMHGYFGTCVSGQKCHTFPGITTCERPLGVGCLSLYLPRRCGQLRPLRMLRQFDWAQRQHSLLARYAGVVVASRHMADEYERNGVPRDRITVANLFPTVPAAASPRPLPAAPAVLFAGRLTNLKGPLTLVEAVAAANRLLNRPIRLILAGEGPQRDAARTLAAERGVDVTLPGWVSGAERTALLRSASIVAVPSRWPEPFGLVGLEAGIHGVPAVAFDVGGISDWLADFVNGRLVRPAGDAVAFGRALAGMLGDAALLDRLGQGASAVAERMSLDRHVAIVEDVLSRASAQAAA